MDSHTFQLLKYIFLAGTLFSCASGECVVLDAHGSGEVLLYPYYTVNHQQTLVSIVNSTARGKALKVRFREGYNGRDVANFDVYLGPFDSWVGSVFDSSADGQGLAGIATNDQSCTVPAFDKNYFSANGAAVLLFSKVNYSSGGYGDATGLDSGPTGDSRTREGFFEVIEMGEVADQSSNSRNTLEAITPAGGFDIPNQNTPAVPPNCAQVVSAWGASGYWTQDATVDIRPPSGGLYGAASIVDVARGTLYAYDATAIGGFSDVAQHTAPNDSRPNLATAVTDSLAGITTSYVSLGNTVVKSDFPASSRAIDAVSSVLMAEAVFNEFDVEQGIAAASDWLVTFPTKQFYVDPGLVGVSEESVLAPFKETFGGGLIDGAPADPGDSCVILTSTFKDREGRPPEAGCGVLCPATPAENACLQTGVMAFRGSAGSSSAVLGSTLVNEQLASPFDAGNVTLIFGSSAYSPAVPAPRLRPALNGNTFIGLPLLGFLAVNYINGNVVPGVLSNYSALYPHRIGVACENFAGLQNACE